MAPGQRLRRGCSRSPTPATGAARSASPHRATASSASRRRGGASPIGSSQGRAPHPRGWCRPPSPTLPPPSTCSAGLTHSPGGTRRPPRAAQERPRRRQGRRRQAQGAQGRREPGAPARGDLRSGRGHLYRRVPRLGADRVEQLIFFGIIIPLVDGIIFGNNRWSTVLPLEQGTQTGYPT